MLGSGLLPLVFMYSVVFARNAIDVMLTQDHADYSSVFRDHVTLLAIFTLRHYPLVGGVAQW